MEGDLWNELIKPMLAYPSEPFDDPNWIFEIKFDGTRCIAYVDVTNKEVRFLNRRLIFFQHRYPELLDIWKNIDASRVILDGEVVVFHEGKPNFFKLAEREHVEEKLRIEILSKMYPATYVVFDILYKDGKNLTGLLLEKRKEILEETVNLGSNIILSNYVREKGKAFFQAAKEKGLEGVMGKKLGSPYLMGERSKYWLKIKALNTLDVVICGYTTGTGKRGETLGSLITGCYVEGKLKYIGKVGTGFDEDELKKLLEMLKQIQTEKCPFEEIPELDLPPERKPMWVKPQLVCEVKFMELTKDGIMRAPSYVRLRYDKLPTDCVLQT